MEGDEGSASINSRPLHNGSRSIDPPGIRNSRRDVLGVGFLVNSLGKRGEPRLTMRRKQKTCMGTFAYIQHRTCCQYLQGRDLAYTWVTLFSQTPQPPKCICQPDSAKARGTMSLGAPLSTLLICATMLRYVCRACLERGRGDKARRSLGVQGLAQPIV